MSINEIIDKIIDKNPHISREQLLERLKKEKTKIGGLISDETLMRMIATDLGLEIQKSDALKFLLSIKDLLPNLNDVTIVGRVVAVFPSKTFEKIKKGKVASLIVADKSGLLRVVLWDDKANVIDSDEIKIGEVARFSHGYTKENRRGKVELHIGDKGEIESNPKGVKAEDFPSIEDFATKINEITKAYRTKRINLVGTVKEVFSSLTFKRKDTSEGKVMRFILKDETAEIPVVVWNQKVDELEKFLRKGSQLQIVNAKVKTAQNGGLEVHVNIETYVGLAKPTEKFFKIADLKEGLKKLNVQGEVITEPILREVKTSDGEIVKLAVFELQDDTGRIWVSAWRKHADFAEKLKLGDEILLKNVYVKKGFSGQLEIATKNSTQMLYRK
jgi:replication factor A1